MAGFGTAGAAGARRGAGWRDPRGGIRAGGRRERQSAAFITFTKLYRYTNVEPITIYEYQSMLQDIKTSYRMQTYRAIWFVPYRKKQKTKRPPQSPTQTPTEALQLPPSVRSGLFTRRKEVSKSRQTEPPNTLRAPRPALGPGRAKQKGPPRGPPPAPSPAPGGQRSPGLSHRKVLLPSP